MSYVPPFTLQERMFYFGGKQLQTTRVWLQPGESGKHTVFETDTVPGRTEVREM